MNKQDVFTNKFSHDIFLQKYSMNGQETWADCCKRVIDSVCGSYLSNDIKNSLYDLMYARKFIPGGRYLACAGRPFKNINNCYMFRAEDSREGWADVMYKATMALQCGGGIGINYNNLREKGAIIKKTGGVSSGPIALMHMVNEAGRFIMMGGGRRSAIFSSLLWSHPDIEDFLNLKNWSEDQKTLKAKDFSFPLPMDGTNISVDYNTEFFVAIENKDHPKHEWAKKVWKKNCLQAFSTAEPGFMFNFLKDNENLRNAPVSGHTKVLTNQGYKKVIDILDRDVSLWTGYNWSPLVRFKMTNENADLIKVYLSNSKYIICDPSHPFLVLIDGRIFRLNAEELIVGDWIESIEPDGFINDIYVIQIERLIHKEPVYCVDVKMPEHSFMAEGVLISNCTEVVSEDDSDKCNLGTLWLNRFKDREEFAKAVDLTSRFLICGNLYTDVPFEKIREVSNKNNRIGLGLGGIHEWLMYNGFDYECPPELHKWLNVYEQESNSASYLFSKEMGLPIPKGARAVAPNGTTGILAESTTGIEPLFCKAYKRRYLKDSRWHYQYVVDGTVKRLLDKGVKIEQIKDSYDLTFEQRVKMQADVQNYTNMAISSTCNLPQWGTELNNEETLKTYSKILLKYAKRLRGFTCYPDGARGGQPLTKISLEDALKEEGKVFEETEHQCIGGICGL